MKFLHPEFFIMLPFIFILFYLLFTDKKVLNHYFSDEILEKLRVNANVLTANARNALYMFAFIFMVIALAQPVIDAQKVKVQAKSSEIMVALDISDSMKAEDFYPSRLELAKMKILEFISKLESQRVGVSAFAKNAYLVSPLSFDHKAVNYLLKQLKPSSITEKGTDFLTLLQSADEFLKDSELKNLLIVTDGGDDKDFSKEIAFAKDRGIKVFILAVATQKGSPVKKDNGEFLKYKGDILISKLNENISELATKTGGTYIEASISNLDIETMLKEIDSKAKKKTLEEEEMISYTQLFYIPLALALLFILIAQSSLRKDRSVQVASLALVALFILPLKLEASLLDFKLLDEAKRSYEAKDFNKSSSLYKDYAIRHKDTKALYNSAVASYKMKDYNSSASMFEKVIPNDDEMRFNKNYNLGNAYASMPSEENFKKAISSYEKALKVKDSQEAKDNLEEVKKALEHLKKQKQKEQNKKQNKQNKKNQDKQNQKNQENKNNKTDQNKDSKNKDKQNKKDNKDKQGSQKSQNKDKKDKESSKNNQNSKEQNKKDKDEKLKSQKSSKDSKKDKKENNKSATSSELNKSSMSEKEFKKWKKRLEKNPVSHIYRLNNQNVKREDVNEKPW